MTRTPFVLLLALAVSASAQEPVATVTETGAQREITLVPEADLVAHEWGVWLLDNGRVTIEDLAGESPWFVVRAPGAPQPVRPAIPQVHVRPVVARKPVLFLRSSTPINDLSVEVRFTGGRPWLLYPQGNVRGNRIRWQGSLSPTRAPGMSRPQRVGRGHWWNHLRAVNADVFSTEHGNERFLFYDGPVRFRSPLRTQRNGNVRARRDERRVWIVSDSRYVEAVVDRRESREAAQGSIADLRGRLEDVLRQRGLSEEEAGSLIRTWDGELFQSDQRRVIYLLERAEYDRMLPLTITPTPRELVRVGLVIQRF